MAKSTASAESTGRGFDENGVLLERRRGKFREMNITVNIATCPDDPPGRYYHFAGIGLAVEDVIGREQSVYADDRAANCRDLSDPVETARYARDGYDDRIIWEGGRALALVRAPADGGPELEVVRLDGALNVTRPQPCLTSAVIDDPFRRSFWREHLTDYVATTREHALLFSAHGLTLDDVIGHVTHHDHDELADPSDRRTDDAAIWAGSRIVAIVQDVFGRLGKPAVTRL